MLSYELNMVTSWSRVYTELCRLEQETGQWASLAWFLSQLQHFEDEQSLTHKVLKSDES